MKPISKPPFFALSWHLIRGYLFLFSLGRNIIHPLKWNEEKGPLQDPKTHAPHSKKDFKVSSVLFLCFWKICWFYVLLRAWWWDIVTLLLFFLVGILNFVWFGWKSLCDHVVLFVLRNFWIVELFGIMKFGQCWRFTKLCIVCILWYCWMNLNLNVVDIGNMKFWCVGMVEQTHFWWVWKLCWNV